MIPVPDATMAGRNWNRVSPIRGEMPNTLARLFNVEVRRKKPGLTTDAAWALLPQRERAESRAMISSGLFKIWDWAAFSNILLPTRWPAPPRLSKAGAGVIRRGFAAWLRRRQRRSGRSFQNRAGTLRQPV